MVFKSGIYSASYQLQRILQLSNDYQSTSKYYFTQDQLSIEKIQMIDLRPLFST